MTTSWPHINEPVELSADESHVWAVPLAAAAAADEWAVLSDDERRRAERFQAADACRHFVVARAALRRLLGRYTSTFPSDIAFQYGASGKPRLRGATGAGLHFNLAHSSELAVIAMTRGCEIGVDVERIRPVPHAREIAARYFHSEEAAWLATAAAHERDATFLHCWSGKEAVLKALGTGVVQSLDFSVMACSRSDGAWISVPAADRGEPARCWLEPLAPSGGYLAAVAFLDAKRRTRCFAFS
jgi:4'-phosphopantetheinyl transferase